MLAGRCIFFYVYLYVYILLLEVYIQGCVFIYKNAYLKRMYKKEKCIHYVAHFFFAGSSRQGCLKCIHMHAHTKSLPNGQAIFKKMYTFACIFFRRFYVYTCIRSFSPFPILPVFFRSRHTHKNTPLPPSPTSAIYFFALLFLRKPKRQTKVAVKKNTSQDETGRKIVQKKK